MNLDGYVRDLQTLGAGVHQVGMDSTGGLQVVQNLPPKAIRAASGTRYGAHTGTGTALAPVQAAPTTTATVMIYNGESDGGKSYFIDKIFCWSVSGTLGLGLSLWAAVSAIVEAAVTTQYSNSHRGTLTGKANDSKAVITTAVTLAATALWIPVASRDQVSAVSVGSGLVADIEGGMIVPPRFGLAITVIAPVGTTALFGMGAVWDELQVTRYY